LELSTRGQATKGGQKVGGGGDNQRRRGGKVGPQILLRDDLGGEARKGAKNRARKGKSSQGSQCGTGSSLRNNSVWSVITQGVEGDSVSFSNNLCRFTQKTWNNAEFKGGESTSPQGKSWGGKTEREKGPRVAHGVSLGVENKSRWSIFQVGTWEKRKRGSGVKEAEHEKFSFDFLDTLESCLRGETEDNNAIPSVVSERERKI